MYFCYLFTTGRKGTAVDGAMLSALACCIDDCCTLVDGFTQQGAARRGAPCLLSLAAVAVTKPWPPPACCVGFGARLHASHTPRPRAVAAGGLTPDTATRAHCVHRLAAARRVQRAAARRVHHAARGGGGDSQGDLDAFVCVGCRGFLLQSVSQSDLLQTHSLSAVRA